MPIHRDLLLKELNNQLQPWLVNDYCPNGLQVEGTETVSKVVTGVTASQALIDAAIEQQADALLVHHGYFWKGEVEAIVGMKKRRIEALLANGINLFAYHLPIDIHPEMGNNAQLGKHFGLINCKPVAGVKPEGILYQGQLESAKTLQQVTKHISSVLGREVLLEGDAQRIISTLSWCTGGGQSFIEQALAAGSDVFISGEVSEQTIHVARENNIGFIAAGHHATERYGVKAVGEWLAKQFDVSVEFVDIDNPA